MSPRIHTNHFVFLFVTLVLGIAASGQPWPGLRGIDGRGSIQPDGILSTTSDVDLKIRWKIKIGSGYSSVVVADGMAVAMFTHDGSDPSEAKEDVVIGVDAESGEQKWLYSLGPFFAGQNGSFDGPLSTPVIHSGKVIGLSPRGRLFCLDLPSGTPVWIRELQQDEKAPQPMYGFTTSPIVVGQTLILQMGSPDKFIAGFDLETGETVWSVGDDKVDSQSPFLADVDGRQMILAVGRKQLFAVDPGDGRLIFEYPHGGGNAASVTPVPIGHQQFLMTLDDTFSQAVAINNVGGDFKVSDAWQSPSIKNTYNIPVLIADHVFGFSTRILTCVDPQTGKPKWKSRPPGDGFLIGVDNHLIVSTKTGSLHVATATPEKYQEIAGLQVFDDLVWSVPAYSDNSVFLRSLGEMARVDIVSRTAASNELPDSELPIGPVFAKFLAEVEAAASDDARSQLVSRFLDAHESTPIIESDIAHFVLRADAEDVAFASDLLGARQEKSMVRVPGTDLFYYSIRLPMDQRANYFFLKDYLPTLDPRNPRVITSSLYKGEMEFAIRLNKEARLQMNWFAMPDWKSPDYLPIPDRMAGNVQELAIDASTNKESESAEDDNAAASGRISIEVYTPPGYDSERVPGYPVAYVFGGQEARREGKLAEIVDSIYQRQGESGEAIVPECLIVFVTTPPMAPLDPKLMPETVVPYIDKHFNTVANRSGRMTVGFSFNGATALMALAANPQTFGISSVQSPLVFESIRTMLLDSFAGLQQPVEIRIEWGRYDMFNPAENWDMRTMTESLASELKKNENVTVTGGMVNDSTDWSSWQNRVDQILRLLGP